MVDINSGTNNFKNLLHIVKKSNEFIKQLESIKNNIF